MRSMLGCLTMTVAAFVAVASCTDGGTVRVEAREKVLLAPTTANATLGSDFVDAAGRLWECKGKVVVHEPLPDAPDPGHPGRGSGIPDPSKPIVEMSVKELAEAIRPVRIVAGYE